MLETVKGKSWSLPTVSQQSQPHSQLCPGYLSFPAPGTSIHIRERPVGRHLSRSVHCKGCSPAGGVSAGVARPGLGRETGKLAALALLEASLAEP